MYNKKSIIIAIIIILILGVGFFFYYKNHKRLTDYPNIQGKITDTFKVSKGYDYVLSSVSTQTDSSDNAKDQKITTEIIGKLIPNGNIAGEYKVNGENQYSFVRSGDKIDVKKAGQDQWEEQNNMFLYETNILSHPEYIQLQKRISNTNLDNKSYLQYEIIFEKPNQEILKSMSQEQLEGLRIYGTVLLDSETFQLKQMKVHKGKTSTNDLTISYTSLSEAPVIEVPKI